jgi:hypothetical protein
MEYMGLRPLTFKILTPTLQAILKSQKLDLKYEKFAHMSPKTSRKKFLLSRFTGGRCRRAASKSRAVGGGPGDTVGGGSGGLKSGNSFNTIDDLSESYPCEVTNKYHMRQVRGGRGSLISVLRFPGTKWIRIRAFLVILDLNLYPDSIVKNCNENSQLLKTWNFLNFFLLFE